MNKIALAFFKKGTEKSEIFLLEEKEKSWKLFVDEYTGDPLKELPRKIAEITGSFSSSAYLDKSIMPFNKEYKCYEVEVSSMGSLENFGQWFKVNELGNLELSAPWKEWLNERAFLQWQEGSTL